MKDHRILTPCQRDKPSHVCSEKPATQRNLILSLCLTILTALDMAFREWKEENDYSLKLQDVIETMFCLGIFCLLNIG